MLFEIFKTPAKTMKDFILVSSLLSLVDKPLKGSVNWEDASVDDISNLEIDAGDQGYSDAEELSLHVSIISIFDTILRGSDKGGVFFGESIGGFDKVKRAVEKSIKALPFKKIIDPQGGHREAFQEILCKIIGKLPSNYDIQTPRIMLLWLLMLSLDIDKGSISPNKFALIDDFRTAFQIEDDIFADLQERAEILHQELSKTMTIINE